MLLRRRGTSLRACNTASPVKSHHLDDKQSDTPVLDPIAAQSRSVLGAGAWMMRHCGSAGWGVGRSGVPVRYRLRGDITSSIFWSWGNDDLARTCTAAFVS